MFGNLAAPETVLRTKFMAEFSLHLLRLSILTHAESYILFISFNQTNPCMFLLQDVMTM